MSRLNVSLFHDIYVSDYCDDYCVRLEHLFALTMSKCMQRLTTTEGSSNRRRGTRRQKLEGSQEDHKTEGFDVINLSMAIDNHTLNEFMRSVYTGAVAIAAIIAYIASPHYVHHHNRINIGKERNELCILWLINLPATVK